MIKVLYLVAGDLSFDEMLYLDAFINQLPSQTVTNHIIAPTLPISHISNKNRNIEITQAKPGFGYEDFAAVLKEFGPQIVILVDPHVLLGPDAADLTYIEHSWLDELPAVVALMDFRANLLKTGDNQLALAPYILADETPPYALDYDFLIKICPPHDAVPTKNPKLMQWGCQDPFSSLAMQSVRENVRMQLGATPQARLVTVVFPMENTFMAMAKGIGEHFQVVIETLIHYLNQLDATFVLSVINMPPPFQDFDFDNVNIRFFPTLDLDLLGNLLKATELFLTESLTYPALVFSALRDIPGIAIGSSVGLAGDGSLIHRGGPLSPFLQLKLEGLKERNPNAIFPFLSFPSRYRGQWLETELFTETYLYHLIDLFEEKRVVSLIDGLLNQGPEYSRWREALRDYRERKLGYTQDAEAIVRRLVTAPPRYLMQ